jgi:hypothetical protein
MVVLLLFIEVPEAEGSFVSLQVASHDHPLGQVVYTCALADPVVTTVTRNGLQAVLRYPHTASRHEVLRRRKQILENRHVGRLCRAVHMPFLAGLEQPEA